MLLVKVNQKLSTMIVLSNLINLPYLTDLNLLEKLNIVKILNNQLRSSLTNLKINQ